MDWKVINKQVLKLQRRIFRATKEAQLKGSGWDKVKNLMKRNFSITAVG
ncbi:MAG: hypothetical protein F6J98_45560 [Moorea sp. SIO4G2]|nr:hypothetical protein [Moorena sp. SIO4G2]